MEVFTVLRCRLPWLFAGLILSCVRLDWWRRNEEGSQCVGDPIGECVSLNFDPRAGRSIQKPTCCVDKFGQEASGTSVSKIRNQNENGK
jgi:hypothetical protein